ncbi:MULTISPECIES: hypothetical protein [Bacillaceae]|uniref:Uncharacterized protein n=1 Tax=Evansella alkalicola TaxID=745819 RepID=A0ABS6JW13_9BACI|nr:MULTISPECIES: hypothetical protein [Bacillaceae]MBU9722786.1 hypothetical protein [Bacillus alkalicola]
MGLFIQLVTPDYPIRDTIIIATVFFLCFLGAYTFGFFAKKKHDEDADDDE